jgi:hypothetical protein
VLFPLPRSPLTVMDRWLTLRRSTMRLDPAASTMPGLGGA